MFMISISQKIYMMIILIGSYLIVLKLFHGRYYIKKENRGFNLYGIIYLLTIGLAFDSVINGIVIVFLFCVRIIQKPKVEIGIFFRIVIAIFYLIFNTLFLFLNRDYLSEQNPYIALVELILYFLLYLIIRTNGYNVEEKIAIIDYASLFAISIFAVALFELKWNISEGLHRSLSIFKSPNQLGIYSAVILALRILYREDTKLSRKIDILIIFISTIMLLLSQSRAAWFGMVVFMFFVIRDMGLKIHWRYIAVLLGGGICYPLIWQSIFSCTRKSN